MPIDAVPASGCPGAAAARRTSLTRFEGVKAGLGEGIGLEDDVEAR